MKTQAYIDTYYAGNFYKHWTPEEDKMVLNKKSCDLDLAYEIERSVSSIQKRRHDLKKKAGAYYAINSKNDAENNK